MTILLLGVGIILAVAIIAGVLRVPNNAIRGLGAVAALVVLLVFAALGSVRYVSENEVGVVIKNFGAELPPGRIIAVNGEKGPQASILGPGWHFFYWPVLYDVETPAVEEIKSDELGLIKTNDGLPLPSNVAFADEWSQGEVQKMLDAKHFLADGGGYKGPQATVLRPGKWRINPKLFEITRVPVTEIEKATAGVVKSNVGDPVETPEGTVNTLVEKGRRGIWKTPLMPDRIYLNTKAYDVTIVSTKERVLRYTKGHREGEEREIEVRTSDGFTFPVDVRVKYRILPEDAPLVVASVGDDQQGLRDVLNSVVRAIFRNNAEGVKALDYVQQRSQQEDQSAKMIAADMKKIGVTITAVAIGDVGDKESLGDLLKTQTDREIARQEQITFQEQQRAAEQRKALTRTQQEAEEERRLATAQYEVKIAEANKQKRIIEANAEAEAIQIKAAAQADAYRLVAEQIGQGNAAMVELLKIIGERGINITPRVMVHGGSGVGGMGGDQQTVALIGTLLDQMVEKKMEQKKPVMQPAASRE